MNAESTDLRKDIVIPQVERLLSLEDRDLHSPTLGCFDRCYWAWKFKDMQDACMQNGVYALALLWSDGAEGNAYYGNDNVLAWMHAGFSRWCAIQRGNGSFDQIFPNEYSYGATAFTLFYMLEAYGILGRSLPGDLKGRFQASARKAAEFIMGSEEKHDLIANHRCAAAAALLNYHLIFGDAAALDDANRIISSLLERQDEGWLPEYGGADPGYQTLALYYLAKYYLKRKSPEMLAVLNKLVEFLSYFIHPDGSIGGEYGSRNTEVFYPAGFALLQNEMPLARRITGLLRDSRFSQARVSLNAMDDGNFIPLLINYIEAAVAESAASPPGTALPLLPFESPPFNRYFKKAKLYVASTGSYYAVSGVCKNGLLKVYDRHTAGLICNDCGYVATTADGSILSTQYINPGVRADVRSDCEIAVRGNFARVRLPVSSPGKIFILRLLNFTVGRSKFLGNAMKRFMVKLLIRGNRRTGLSLERSIAFAENSILVSDTLSKPASLRIAALSRGEKHSTMHMATARYFKKSELLQPAPYCDFDVGAFNRDNVLASAFTIAPQRRSGIEAKGCPPLDSLAARSRLGI